jgi:hypothetical protein
MARINDAWHTLSDAASRARWDRSHALVTAPHWAPVPAETARRPTRVADAPASPMDSGWAAIGILAGVVLVVGTLMIRVTLASRPVDDRLSFAGDELSFAYPPDWQLFPGDGADAPDHRVIAHVVTFDIEPTQQCTSFATPCPLTGDAIPPGEASILISAWEGGTPPVADPVTFRPFGRDADRIIGGKPAASEMEEVEGGVIAWWQLSPPGFPDRWIEIRADVGGQRLDRERVLAAIDAMLETLEFEP